MQLKMTNFVLWKLKLMQQWLEDDLFYKTDHLSNTYFTVFFKFIYFLQQLLELPSVGNWNSVTKTCVLRFLFVKHFKQSNLCFFFFSLVFYKIINAVICIKKHCCCLCMCEVSHKILKSKKAGLDFICFSLLLQELLKQSRCLFSAQFLEESV